jgi:hypothetical protein
MVIRLPAASGLSRGNRSRHLGLAHPRSGLRRRVCRAAVTALVAVGAYAAIPVISVGAATTPSPTISLDRSTGLLQGQIVNVTGSGFAPFTFGQITECSNAPGQPTIASSGVDLPVSCGSPNFSIPAQLTTNPFTSVSQNGVLTGSIVVETGVLGPPALGTDSAGNNAAVDAVKYSCPPTAAQTAAGRNLRHCLRRSPRAAFRLGSQPGDLYLRADRLRHSDHDIAEPDGISIDRARRQHGGDADR